MKKIGTISLNINAPDFNYGAMLHSWAFQQYLLRMDDVDTEIINYTIPKVEGWNRYDPQKSKEYYRGPRYADGTMENYLRRAEKFDNFIKNNLKVSEKKYVQRTIAEADLPYDVIICESDVTWSPRRGKLDPVFFLATKGMQNKRRIAYSPSMADAELTKEQEEQLEVLLKNLHFISCRESKMENILREHTDKPVKHVVDPVMLLDPEDYDSITAPRLVEEKYMFLYLPVNDNEVLRKHAKEYADKHDLKILEISTKLRDADEESEICIPDAGIEEFLSAIKYSEIVFTNSFHAVCFSIMYGRQFYAFTRKHNVKVLDACRFFGLEDYYVFDDQFVEKEPFDVERVTKRYKELQKESREWLENALTSELPPDEGSYDPVEIEKLFERDPSIYRRERNAKPKVSVIIPVYNGEAYLKDCLESICFQTFSDIEIIIVDDGSTDTTPDIAADYCEIDPRIKTWSQDNQYAGVARNLGMSHASGEYLLFIDVDDYLEQNAIEMLYKKASENTAEICVCGANQRFKGRGKALYHCGYMDPEKIPENTAVFNRKSNQKYILNFTNAVVWNKLFLKSFVKEKDLQFQPIRNGEEIFFVVNAMCMADRITTVEDALVNHRKNVEGSLTETLSKGGLEPFKAWTSTAENLKHNNIFPEQSFANRAAKSILGLLNQMDDFEVFRNAVDYLQSGALTTLCITEREEGYYYSEVVGEAVSHLIKDSPEQLLMYLKKVNYMRLAEISVLNRVRERSARLKNARIVTQRETIQQQEEKLQKQKDRILRQKEKLQILREKVKLQEEQLDEQNKILNSKSVKAVLKLRKL